MDFIPKSSSFSLNYWCTWALQNYIFGQNQKNFNIESLEGDKGALNARNNINETLLVGENGWVKTLYPKIRNDLLLLIDDGWDVPLDTQASSDKDFSSFDLNEVKFPSFKGNPQEKLSKLNKVIKELGWRGMGVWVAAQEAQNYLPNNEDKVRERFWADRMQWSHQAGITYWKVDWGHKERRIKFRRFLSELSHEQYPDLVIDHSVPTIPFNSYDGNGRAEYNYIKRCIKHLEFSDVVRVYDVSPQLSIPTTLDRAAKILKEADFNSSDKHFLSCDDEVYIAAALGCTMGIMRHPFQGLRGARDIDLSFEGPRKLKRKIDEVIRAVHWQRIAPHFDVSRGDIKLSKEILFDDWIFQKGDTWFSLVIGDSISQGAPAIIARGLELPVVEAKSDAPYVIASRNPNGAIAVATLGRTSYKKGYYLPKVDVSINIIDEVKYLGIFGYYNTLTLCFEDRNIRNVQIYAQDLAENNAIKINRKIIFKNNELTLKGELIEKLSFKSSKRGDLSEPGLLLYLKRE